MPSEAREASSKEWHRKEICQFKPCKRNKSQCCYPVSYLCGGFSATKKPSTAELQYSSHFFSTRDDGDAVQLSKHPNTEHHDTSVLCSDEPLVDRRSNATESSDHDHQIQPLPPPPGGGPQHLPAASYHHHHSRSNSATKLLSSMSLRVLGGNKEKNLNPEDSIWKKTIILGEKCRVPEEDEGGFLYDEKGRRISAYHPRTKSGAISMSGQTSGDEHE